MPALLILVRLNNCRTVPIAICVVFLGSRKGSLLVRKLNVRKSTPIIPW